MATYLVTGGAGFIGSNLARALVAKGETVRVIDNFSSGKKENLAGIEDKIELHTADITDGFAVQSSHGADRIGHLDAPAAERGERRGTYRPLCAIGDLQHHTPAFSTSDGEHTACSGNTAWEGT